MRPAKARRAAVWLAVLLCLPAAAQELQVSATTLENGMRLLIHEDHDIPNAALYLFYRVGSRNERPGITGISHFFEHMMFNGAKKYGPQQFDIQMEKHGGRNNAYTSRDLTVYTNWFPSNALELMLDLEADRIRDLAFDPQIIESERGVVANERRQSVDNSNFGLLYEQLNAAAYTAHPYAWPVIGWASDIQAWTMQDLKDHFRMGYAPNNCVVVITGAVKTAAALALARKYLEPIPRQDPPPPVRTREPEQLGERRVTVRKPAQLPLLFMSFHVPDARHEDRSALEVLGAALAQGRSSRLYRRLVDRDQLAVSVNQSYSWSLDPGQFFLSVQPRSGVDPARAEAALTEELEKLRKEEIPASELEKARSLLLVDLYRDLKTIAGKAQALGQFEVYLGDHRKLFQAREELAKVSAADVRRVAKTYLHARNRTVATLIPDDSKEGAQ